jgi:hypothetical protein
MFSLFSVWSQELTAAQLLDKSIAFHDPDKQWSTFEGDFTVEMTTPNASKRVSHIKINLPLEYFSVSAKRDSVNTYYEINKGQCKMLYNGKSIDSINDKGMSCDRAVLYKNYYTYLYGLPMKLKDPGTVLDKEVEKRTFKNRDYLVLKVSYDASTGSDIWFFYFNPSTYAMEVYQFFKTDDSGRMILDSGEYILLSEIFVVNGIKMPQTRAWYYNKDNKHLGTDTLIEN